MRTILWLAGLLAAAVPVGAAPSADDPLAFDYFENNWNVIGLKDYRHGTRVSPDHELWVAGRTAIQTRFGRDLRPLSRHHGTRALEGWMPILETTAHDGPVRYAFLFWASPLPDCPDWQKAYGWPVSGENFLNWIRVRITNTSSEAVEARLDIRPNPAIKIPAHPEEQAEPSGLARHERAQEWRWTLPAGQAVEAVARYPFFPVEPGAKYDGADATLWLERTREYWRGLMDRAARIEVPCRKATEALLAAHVCQLIANDHGEVRAGENFYDVFYIRDGAYQLLELEEAGFLDTAATAIELYLKRQRPDGRFESQANQFDANGQAVWTLWQYSQITGDRAFLERVYPAMLRAVRWAMQARRQAPADSPFAGLLPAAPADGEFLWGGTNHIVGYDFWNLRGLLCAAHAARTLGRTNDAQELLAEAQAWRADLDAAWKRTGLAHFPPSWEKVGTHWGNTETLWPTPLFAREDPRVAALSRFVRREFAGGFIEGIIQWKGGGNVDAIHPYMGAYTTMTDLIRGEHEQVVEDFYWYLLHSSAAHAFPEGIYYRRREAWNHTIPHVTGACNYAILLRHILVHEDGDELHLLRAVPDGWLAPGQTIRAERLPTHFGPMSLVVRGRAEGVAVELAPPTRTPPRRTVLHLPRSRPLARPVPGVETQTRGEQAVRWDFAEVVRRYGALQRQRGFAENLTTGKPVTCSHALPGFPARLANDGFANDTDAYWATDVTRHPEAWWQVDLEEAVPVNRVVVVAYYGDRRSYGFTVETSLDGRQWTMAADRRNNQELATAQGYVCAFAPRPTRYIRVTQTTNSANTGRHLVEVRAYADRPAAPPPAAPSVRPPGGA